VPTSPLIAPDELAGWLRGATAPTVLDVRWALGARPGSGAEAHRAGHVPGAVYVDLDTELAGSPGRAGRHPLPDPAGFEAAMRRAGVSATRPVVVYDDASSVAAARAWWLLRYHGHPDVRVLDGGLGAWTAAGYPVESAMRPAEPGDFVARPGGMPLLDAKGAARLAGEGVLLDARTPERFRGESEPIDPVAGHIPGAVNLPGAALFDETGRFLSPERLGERFAAAGVDPRHEVGSYCGSGVSAAHEVLALELAGYRAALYVGSWSEWIADPRRPVARGA
jgi:thiosulfate/3-mercaptopyruvate sulfurtransferase